MSQSFVSFCALVRGFVDNENTNRAKCGIARGDVREVEFESMRMHRRLARIFPRYNWKPRNLPYSCASTCNPITCVRLLTTFIVMLMHDDAEVIRGVCLS